MVLFNHFLSGQDILKVSPENEDNIWSTLSLFVKHNYCYPNYRETLRPGGHLDVTLQGGAHFVRISTTRLREKIALRYPVSELLDYKKFKSNRETIVYCY